MAFWVTIGLLGQFLFAGRFFVQWISSERKKESHIPEAFWYLSILGGIILLAYAVYRKDPVFIVGQAMGLGIYARNIQLISKKKRGTHKQRHEENFQEITA